LEIAQTVRAETGERETCILDRRVAYVSIRRNQRTEFYRIVGFEDSTDPNPQNLYGDFTEGQANAILVRVGMSPSQAKETLAKVIEFPHIYRFHLELTSEQDRFFRYSLGGSRHVSEMERIASRDLGKARLLHSPK
jgi:hypothetical protein